MKQGTNLADRRDQAVETVSNENHPTGAFQALGKGELVELYEPLLGCQVRYHQKRSDAESVVHCIMLLAAILLPWLILLEPISQDMLAAKLSLLSISLFFGLVFTEIPRPVIKAL